MAKTTDGTILVAGTGPAGLAAALAIASLGRGVVLAGPAPNLEDRRTTALMLPAYNFLERHGVTGALDERIAPMRVMRVVDLTERLIRSPTVTFSASEVGEEAFGYNIPNAALNAALADAVRARANITWHESLVDEWQLGNDAVTAHLSDGTTVRALLAAAADGRNSPARQAAGIATSTRRLPQSALVFNFAHERHHGYTSTEFHTENGPCAQVPLPGGRRSSLVWVNRPEDAEALAALDDAALSLRLEERLRSFLGKVTVEPGRQVYPLASVLPARFAARRVALLGEAAHVFPPITAQGLNLGLRDVADLADTVARHPADPGATAALAHYDMRRRPDILARIGAVNLFNESLLTSFLPVQLARSAGLSVLQGTPFLRALFMREGMQPGSGLKALLPPFARRRDGAHASSAE